MRDIKVRGINEETGKFVHGWYTKLIEGVRRIDAIISEIDDELIRFYIHDNKTIGQLTGLQDKNGVDIYEGDIVKAYVEGYNCGGIGAWETAEVKYNERNAVFENCRFKNKCEVIGNIHESPELLEAT